MKNLILAALAAVAIAPSAHAENRTYGQVYLAGLARDNAWPLNAPGLNYVMVCNVNGPDGFLSVRSGAGTEYQQVRAFNRLAILEVDTTNRRGNWVRVVDGSRTHSKDGFPQEYKHLSVSGWAHDGYLCDFVD